VRAKWQQFLFTWHAAFGGILLAMEGMRELNEAADRQAEIDLITSYLHPNPWDVKV
jgi:hypothetical protein